MAVLDTLGLLREALKQYMTALEALADKLTKENTSKADEEFITKYPIESDPSVTDIDQRVRERLIKVVQRLDVPPEVPEKAHRKARCALAAVRDATILTASGDLDAAIVELKDALRLAPWWGEGYLHLAWMMESRENYSDAARSLMLYLHATPKADNVDAVKRKIIWLENAARPRWGLGVTVQRVTPDLVLAFGLKDNVGVLIADVYSESPASRAGLERGDFILEFDGKKPEDVHEFMQTLQLASPGKAVSVKIWREGREQELVATIGEFRPIRKRQHVLRLWRSAAIERCVNESASRGLEIK